MSAVAYGLPLNEQDAEHGALQSDQMPSPEEHDVDA